MLRGREFHESGNEVRTDVGECVRKRGVRTRGEDSSEHPHAKQRTPQHNEVTPLQNGTHTAAVTSPTPHSMPHCAAGVCGVCTAVTQPFTTHRPPLTRHTTHSSGNLFGYCGRQRRGTASGGCARRFGAAASGPGAVPGVTGRCAPPAALQQAAAVGSGATCSHGQPVEGNPGPLLVSLELPLPCLVCV